MSKRAFVFWSIWYFKNQIIFQKNANNNNNTIEFIKKQIHDLNRVKKEDGELEHEEPNRRSRQGDQRRQKKDFNWENQNSFKLNSSGSRLQDDNSSTGFIIRYHQANTIVMRAKKTHYNTIIRPESVGSMHP